MPHVIKVKLEVLKTTPSNIPIHLVPAANDNIIFLIEYEAGCVAAVDGPSATAVLEYCQNEKLDLTHILNTHTHGDHIGINHDLQRQGKLKDITVVGARNSPTPIPGLSMSVTDGDTFKLGQNEITVWLTEGHINGHISFILDDFLFCGDTLFTGGCGYLFDGPPLKMYNSLKRLALLPPNTKVCCAHEYTLDNLWFAYSLEPQNADLCDRISHTQKVLANGGTLVPSTIELELATNPFLRTSSPEIIEQLHQSVPDLILENANQTFAAIRELKNQKHYRQTPLPIL